MNENSLILSKAELNTKRKITHTPSVIQADTLFTFMTELRYLLSILENRMISPRYNDETINYLRIPKIKKIAFPMKCFCDINLHRMEEHLEWYGYYGLAFSKEWGMNKGIQPIQYINSKSKLREDFSTSFSAALKADSKKESRLQTKMKNYLLHQLMYIKPYEGKMENRNTGRIKKKCFTDECEWRFVPDVTRVGFKQIYFDKGILNAGSLGLISNSMEGVSDISLEFDYEDLKYIIVKEKEDLRTLIQFCNEKKMDDEVIHQLVSKVIVWEDSKGDF